VIVGLSFTQHITYKGYVDVPVSHTWLYPYITNSSGQDSMASLQHISMVKQV